MDKSEVIKNIEQLYPPDSDYPDTAEVGQILLDRAKEGYTPANWRDEPEGVLRSLLNLCIQMDEGSSGVLKHYVKSRRKS